MNKRVITFVERVLLFISIVWGILLIIAALNAGLSHQVAFIGVLWVIVGTFGFPAIVFICAKNIFFNRRMFREGFQLYASACCMFFVFLLLYGGLSATVFSLLADVLTLIRGAYYFEQRKWLTIKP